MLYKLLQILYFLPVSTFAENRFNDLRNFTKIVKNNNNITFKDYLNKFHPGNVWAKIEKRNKLSGITNKTVADELDAMFNGIDETDELLKLKVQNGNPKIVLQKDGRKRFVPPGDWVSSPFNDYNLKDRMLELAKQTVYQARYKMVIMQNIRNKYKRSSIYKMGFLMSKTDNACKTFGRFAYKAIRDCGSGRGWSFRRISTQEILLSIERVINLLFQVELLVDLVIKNDENCQRMLNEVMTNRKHAWKFVD